MLTLDEVIRFAWNNSRKVTLTRQEGNVLAAEVRTANGYFHFGYEFEVIGEEGDRLELVFLSRRNTQDKD